MRQIIHMSANVQGLLDNYKGKDSLEGLFTDADTGYPVSDRDARIYLNECLKKGWQVIPCAECDNFDYQTGCKGHPKEKNG